MSDVKDILQARLRERLRTVNKSPHSVSRAIGAGAGYVSDLLSENRFNMPTAERLTLIAAQLETTTDYLLGRAETPAQPGSEVDVRDFRRPYRGGAGPGGEPGVPVVGGAFCDDLAVEGENGGPFMVERVLFEQDHTIRWVERPPALAGAEGAYAIYYFGSSMEPRYFQGEMGMVDPRRRPGPGDFVVVQLNDGQTRDVITIIVKRLVRSTSQYLELEQFNPPQTFRIPQSQVVRVHRIVPNNELYGG